MKSLFRVVAVTAMVALLGACGGIRPGAAAVVDGKTISIRQTDDAAAVYCKLSLLSAQQQGVSSVNNAEVRRSAVTDLVTAVVADRLAEEEGLVVKPADYQLTQAQRAQLDELFGDDSELAQRTIESSQKIYFTAVALGEKATGTAANDQTLEVLVATGREELANAFDNSDISFDPRFGLSKTTAQIAETGSLSVAEVTTADVPSRELPPAQRCA